MDFFMTMGPDRADNLHQGRPYFLLPLKTGAEFGARSERKQRRKEAEDGRENAIDRIKSEIASRPIPVSDIYVISHGWHRNFYSAVSAYDRLISRMSALFSRQRLQTPPNYNPIFITLHWSSEVGTDQWVDMQGRRHKPSFLDNAANYWEESDPGFLNLFEDIFELFSSMSAPDSDAGANTLIQNSQKLCGQLLNAPIKPCYAHMDEGARISACWKCYHEAVAKGVHVPQQIAPQPNAGVLLRASIVIKFALALVPLVVIIPKLANWIAPHIPRVQIFQNPILNVTILLTALTAISVCGLWASGNYSRGKKERLKNWGVSWMTMVPWTVLQILFAIPTLFLLLLNYIAPFMSAPEKPVRNWSPLVPALWLAGLPTKLLEGAIEQDTLAFTLTTAVGSQMAFFEMQSKGVRAGIEAAAVLREIVSEENAKHARIHVFGHSFGGLLAANLAKAFVDSKNPRCLETLCFIEGAFASGWFKEEVETVNNVNGRLAAFYSCYDSATGFYYPLATGGRLAIGSVGASQVPKGNSNQLLEIARPQFEPNRERGKPDVIYCSMDCTVKHLHFPRPYASLADSPILPREPNSPTVLNLDASRMVYEGPVASGGAHTDIFKDDVVNLLWAVAHSVPLGSGAVVADYEDIAHPSGK